MELDTTRLRQAGFRKTVSHDNCNVLDIGSGSYPRYIEVRPPGDDGSRMTAIWDGILDLAVNDKVICIEYSGNSIWRVNAIGGGGSGVGAVRVNKVWESDFGNVALQADATGQVEIGKTSGPDAQLDVSATATQLRLTHTDGSKFADMTVDTNHNLTITPSSAGQVIFQPTTDSTDFFQVLDADGGDPILNVDSTNETVSIRTASTTLAFQGITLRPNLLVFTPDSGNVRTAAFQRFSDISSRSPQNAFFRASAAGGVVSDGWRTGQFFFSAHDGTDYNQGASFRAQIDGPVSANTVPMSMSFLTSATNSGGLGVRLHLASNGRIGLGNVTTPLAKAHIDQSSTTAAIPTLFLDQGDISEQCITFSSDGASRDIIIYDINVAGTPTMLWDESADGLNWNKGFLIGGSFETNGERIVSTETHTSTGTLADTVEEGIANSASAFTLTLPAHKTDKRIRITNIGVGAVTLSPTSGDIKGASTQALVQFESLILLSDNTDWL